MPGGKLLREGHWMGTPISLYSQWRENMLPRRKVEAEICLTSFRKLLCAEMNNRQKCSFLCIGYRGTRKANLEMS